MEEPSFNKRVFHQPKPRRERTMAQLTPTEVRAAIVTANETFMAAFSRGDAAALAASYTGDGQLLPPHSDIITGKQAIEAFWQSAMDMGIK
jgi:ketosteroid isomerase-like protein